MSENLKENKYDEVEPTLFIALGGTGFEVLSRIRRRILNTLWKSGGGEYVRINSLNEFPFAEFLHIDLDTRTVTEQGRSHKSDILANRVIFKEEEKLVKKLDMNKYIASEDSLASYPLVKEWFPLPRAKVIELGINPDDGAGQIRAISRLYFFDKYQEIKNKISSKAAHLLANINSHEAAKRLGMKVQTSSLKIVVVASTAGGTGSGSFLDMGYLCQIVGKKEAHSGVTTNLVLMLPTGYRGAGAGRTQANTYGALMELETCMRPGGRFIKKWSEIEELHDMPDSPYSNVYLVDTANVAGEQTEDKNILYEMLADALFEDFSTAEFANKKRSITVNKNQHKILPYVTPVNKEQFGDMKLTFSRGYSTFGQAIIDTHIEQKKNVVIYRQVNGMLNAFFGIASSGQKSNLPTEGERDEILATRMYLGPENEIIDYHFAAPAIDYRKGLERTNYPVVIELLRVNGISRLDDIEKRIVDRFDEIRNSGNFREWPTHIAKAILNINHDTFKTVEQGSGLHEDGIRKRRAELLAELLNPEPDHGLVKALWARVDNKERGGLDYTIELILRLKDRLENANTGLVKILEENAKWFSDLSGFMRNEEVGLLQEHLRQAIAKFFNSKSQSEMKLNQIAEAVKLYVRYHLYSVASKEAAVLVKELSDGLGKQNSTDVDGNPVWSGIIGELESGRRMVTAIINDTEAQIDLTNEAMRQGHAMYFVLPAPKSKIDELELLPPSKARQWAEEVFKDFGGTRQLFAILQADDGRSELIGKLRNRALDLVNDESQKDEENPLFTALDQHSDLRQLFGDFFRRAMPWVAARLDKYLREQGPSDQYQCYIGVKDKGKFESRYGNLLKSALPASTMMTPEQIGYVEIDTPGRVVCYTELTGIPLPSLKGLGDWYVSYKTETSNIPVNTHYRASVFVHPRELNPAELTSRAEDVKLFIQAVALGELVRSDKKGEEAGLYILNYRGTSRYVGDEKKFRQDGFLDSHRAIINEQVMLSLDRLKSPDQLALWVALMEYYHDAVYPVFEILVEGVNQERKSLPTIKCRELVSIWTKKFNECMEDSDRANELLDCAKKELNKWTDEISGSDTDVYYYEVNTRIIKPKRVLKQAVLREGWSLKEPSQTQVQVSPPPVVNQSFMLFVHINGQQAGPYDRNMLQQMIQTGQITGDTPVWMSGMPSWITASTVPELQPLFVSIMPSVQVYAHINGQQAGPLDSNMLQQMIRTGQIGRDTMVWMNGMASWAPASTVADISSLFGSDAPPPLPGSGGPPPLPPAF